MELPTRIVGAGTITGNGLPASFAAPKGFAAEAGCTTSLGLGPLNLDLLGVAVDPSPANLVATVVPGVAWSVRHVR